MFATVHALVNISSITFFPVGKVWDYNDDESSKKDLVNDRGIEDGPFSHCMIAGPHVRGREEHKIAHYTIDWESNGNEHQCAADCKFKSGCRYFTFERCPGDDCTVPTCTLWSEVDKERTKLVKNTPPAGSKSFAGEIESCPKPRPNSGNH